MWKKPIDSHTTSALPLLTTVSPKDLTSAEFISMCQSSAWAPNLLVTGLLVAFLKPDNVFPSFHMFSTKVGVTTLLLEYKALYNLV